MPCRCQRPTPANLRERALLKPEGPSGQPSSTKTRTRRAGQSRPGADLTPLSRLHLRSIDHSRKALSREQQLASQPACQLTRPAPLPLWQSAQANPGFTVAGLAATAACRGCNTSALARRVYLPYPSLNCSSPGAIRGTGVPYQPSALLSGELPPGSPSDGSAHTSRVVRNQGPPPAHEPPVLV